MSIACTKTNNPPVHKPPIVDAGPAQSISLPNSSVTLTGKVTDSGSKVVGYLWSEVSGPNVPVITAESSATTGVTGLIAGTYVFQLEATDTFGLTGVDTVSVSVHTGSATYTLAPYNNPNEAQWIGIGSTDWGGAGQASKELGAEAWTISGNTVYVRAAFQFDFTTLPTGPAKSAYLTLYSNPTPYTANLSTPNFGTANAFYIQRVNTSWNAATATWSTQPTVDTTGEILIPQTNASALDLTNVDVTGLVNTMIATGNHGFMIRLQNEVIYNSRIFCSSKYSDSTRRPKLVVNY